MPRPKEKRNPSTDSLNILDSSEPANSNLESLLDEVARLVERGELPNALRLADRARRIVPGNSSCIVLCARLLIQLGFAGQALEYLQDERDPEISVARAEAFCKLGQFVKASQGCGELLRTYSVDAVEGLTSLASRLCLVQEGDSIGWIGVGDNLTLAGEVRRGCRLDIRSPEAVFHPVTFKGSQGDLDAFVCDLSAEANGQVTARADDRELIGSAIPWPPRFSPSAWVALGEDALVGEAKLDWSPKLSLMLAISNPDTNTRKIVRINEDRSSASGSFSFALSGGEPESGNLEVAVILPDGKEYPLVGSPLNLGDGRRQMAGPNPTTIASRRGSSAKHDGRSNAADIVDIIVPVFEGLEETLTCLKQLFCTTTRETAEIVVVNDASPDPQLGEELVKLAAQGRITLLMNEANLGFPGTANRGMRLHPYRDVILINSDVEVFGDWVERLQRTAQSSDDIGTVTPLGEAGSIMDYSCGDYEAAEIDRIASEVNGGRVIDLPVAVGFCMYIRRGCLDQTGEFDEEHFAKGYGEENDFCLRATSIGWRHVAATNVFVRHQGGRSFGKTKELLRKRNSIVLNRLHPGYDALIEEFSAADPLYEARRFVDMRLLQEKAINPVLIITHDLPGGVKRYVGDRQARLIAGGHTVIILKPLDARNNATKVTLEIAAPGFRNLTFDLPVESEAFFQLLSALKLSHVEFHHFLGLPSHVFETVRALKVPFDIYAHDYSWICPRVTLIDGREGYCGEPALGSCEECVSSHGTLMDGSLTVRALRSRSAEWLYAARRLFAPAKDVGERYERYFPERKFTITPWQTLSEHKSPPSRKANGRTRVAVIGAIGIQKGYKVLLDCALDAAERNLDIEFTVIGYSLDDQELLDTGRVFITGPFQESEIGMLLDREQCDVAWIPSVSPETWSYALSHAMERCLPIVAFDLGAQAERLRQYPTAMLLPLLASPEELNTALSGFRKSSTSLPRQEDADLEQEVSTGVPRSPMRQSGGLTSSVQVLKLPPGLYSFAVRSGGSERDASGILALPALQLGLAPTRSSANVAFFTGGSTIDRWLANQSDVIFVKITGDDAALLLNSVRTQEGHALAVDVKHLDTDGAPPVGRLGSVSLEPWELSNCLPVRLLAHLKSIGDLEFQNSWAGWPGHELWIESFAVSAVGHLPPDSLEYRGVVANGYETPWLRNRAVCGTRGGGSPLIGFAVRLKPEFKDRYECSYSGRFISGLTVGPLKGEILCSSERSGDPLEAIEILILDRHNSLLQMAVSA